jgi:hypothetical protein
VRTYARYFIASTMGMLLATAVHGADCYNDEIPARSDLEPPVPGSNADLLRVSDDDVNSMLEAARAYEERFRVARDAAAPGK